MKKSQICHILDSPATPAPTNDPELVFTHLINSVTGKAEDTSHNPQNWEDVRHLRGNLYYAFNRSAPDLGRVYVGEFR